MTLTERTDLGWVHVGDDAAPEERGGEVAVHELASAARVALYAQDRLVTQRHQLPAAGGETITRFRPRALRRCTYSDARSDVTYSAPFEVVSAVLGLY